MGKSKDLVIIVKQKEIEILNNNIFNISNNDEFESG